MQADFDSILSQEHSEKEILQNSVNSLQLVLNHIHSRSEDSLLKQASRKTLESKLEIPIRACQYYILCQQDQSSPAERRAYRNAQDLMRALGISTDQFANLPLLPYKFNSSDLPTEMLLDS